MKLLDLISGLPESQLEELAARWHVVIDAKKRLGVAEQVARGVVLVPRWLDLRKASEGAREALRLLAAAPRGVPRESLPREVETLIDEGFVFVTPGASQRVVLPAAFRLQLPASPSDSPRSARILLQNVPEEARREVCFHHWKRLPPLPWPMLLELVLERLEDASWVKTEIGSLGETERTLLWAIDALGGEVSAEEVLELEREPIRIHHGGAVQVPRRSAIFTLARRGLVVARHEGWTVPDEVERVVGSQRRARAGIERQRLLMSRHLHELTPSRAQLAEPVGPLTVALLAALSSIDQLPAETRGTSRTAIRRVAQDLMVDPERAELLVCLARAEGLLHASTPVAAVTERVWTAWRRGGAWDEAAREPDLFRPGHPMTAKATMLIRDALLDTLALLPAGEFSLGADVLAAASADRRALAAQRSLSMATRAGQDVMEHVTDVAKLLLERSLSWLGMVDHGRVDEGPVVRISQAARAWLDDAAPERGEESPDHDGEWLGDMRIACGPRCDVAAIIEAARYGSVWLDDRRIGIELRHDTLARAADHDPDLSGLRTALSSLSGSAPPALEAAIREATLERPLVQLTRASGFVFVDDAELRAALYADPDGDAVWAGPPLAEGLLVLPGVSAAKVQLLLTRHGARVHAAE
jgi:hypothetical protein